MMKNLLMPIAMLAALTALAQETHLEIKVPDRVEYDLAGPVKRILVDDCTNLSDKHKKEERRYDLAGNLLTKTCWNSKDEISFALTNSYNADGCFVSWHSENPEQKKTNDWEVLLNPPTHQIAMRNLGNGDTSVYTYSPEKYLMHYKKVDKDKKTIRSSRYRRRPDHKEAEYTSFDEKNRPVYTYNYRWTADPLFIDRESVRYHQEDKSRLHTYEYLKVDAHTNWTQRIFIRYKTDGSKQEKMYETTTLRTIEYFEE